jgi:hypothetical protein
MRGWQARRSCWKPCLSSLEGVQRCKHEPSVTLLHLPLLQGYCRSLGLTGLKASKWDGDWATYDIALGAFAWSQNWDGNAQFNGCGQGMSAWDVNQARAFGRGFAWQPRSFLPFRAALASGVQQG